MIVRASIIVPITLIIAIVAWFFWAQPFDYLTKGTPPIESLTIDRVTLDQHGIHATVQAAGSKPISVVQLQVDGAYREFTQSPKGPIGYLAKARFDIPYPWITGEAHHLLFVTSSGTTFPHTIGVAVATPGTGPGDIVGLALIGLFVGIIPIIIGFAFYPAMMSFGESGRHFAMAITVGLLAFLLVDTIGEGLEIAEKVTKGLKADLIIWLSALISCILLIAVGRRTGKPPEGISLAFFIAIGIGVHNLAEGLVIGASFSIGEVALASFLVLGFALHNVTEGIAISAPIRREAASISTFILLALIAGGPAVLGTMSGALSFSHFWTALAFGIGAGAILQVIVEVTGACLRQTEESSVQWYSPATLSGFIGGVGIMYATSFIAHG